MLNHREIGKRHCSLEGSVIQDNEEVKQQVEDHRKTSLVIYIQTFPYSELLQRIFLEILSIDKKLQTKRYS
jgi:uncharacterized protein YdhG (YjbR/CyaY superfamily)